MKTVFVGLVVGIIVSAGCSVGDSSVRAGYDFSRISRIAVVEVAGAVSGDNARNQIGDFFVMQLLKKGYAPIERAQVQAILAERKLQSMDLATAEGAAKAGKILNVPAVLIVNVGNFSEEISMTVKMVDVEDGSVLWVASGSGKTGRLLSTVAGAAAGAAGGAAVAGDDDEGDKTVGAVAGGVLGGVAGHTLSPQKADKAKEIINRMCKSLPSAIGGS